MTDVICAVGGLMLLISFFLPWFSRSLTCGDPRGCQDFSDVTESFNGLKIATKGAEHTGFVFLWLVVLAGLALVVLPLLVALLKKGTKPLRFIILAAAALGLVVELIFLFQIVGLAAQDTRDVFIIFTPTDTGATFDFRTLNVSAGPAFGLYLAILATLVAGGIYLAAMLAGTRKKGAEGERAAVSKAAGHQALQ